MNVVVKLDQKVDWQHNLLFIDSSPRMNAGCGEASPHAILRHTHEASRDKSHHAATARDVLLCEGAETERKCEAGCRADSV